jgi:hypothetical protein
MLLNGGYYIPGQLRICVLLCELPEGSMNEVKGVDERLAYT